MPAMDPMDLYKLAQDEIVAVAPDGASEGSSSSRHPWPQGVLLRPSSTQNLNSPAASSSRLSAANDSQSALLQIDIHGNLQRPAPMFSTGESSRAGSYYGTTACNTPKRWSFSEKGKKKVEIFGKPAQSVSSSNCSSTFDIKYNDNLYAIEKLHENDDYELLPRWKFWLSRLSPLTTLLAVGSYYLYFPYRIYCTRESSMKWGQTYVMAWLFIVAEALVALPALFHQAWLILSARGRSRPKLRLHSQSAPTIDVLITCCKEDIDVILDTTRAACSVDYPQDRFRVVVLDDGGDEELKKSVEDLARDQFGNLFYHARVKTKPHHAKAGNLIGGTNFVTTLEGGAGEYLAALDADMIPEPDWLRAIVAHMIKDPKLALACPPQLFYNVPHNDQLAQSLDAFVHVTEPSKDATGVAWCTGSGYIIRRAALDSIGGWPTGSLAEDVCTSSMLLGMGWKTAYIHEPLQYGQVPDSFTGHLKQRTRWTLGTLQTATKLRFFLWGKIIRKMTFFQRLSGFVFSVDALLKMFLLISMATIPIVLASGGVLVAYTDTNQLRWQIRLCTISLLLTILNGYITYLPSGYRLGRQESSATIWMAPYHTIVVIRSFLLPRWLGGKALSFKPSGSIKDELNERSALHRAPLWRRLKVIMIDCGGILHLLFVLFVLTAVVLSTIRAFSLKEKWVILEYLLTHACWPPMLWVTMIHSCLIPLRYAIVPPSVPEREDLLDRDPKTGVARPKEEWKLQRWTKRNYFKEVIHALAAVYTVALFVGTFTWGFIGPDPQRGNLAVPGPLR